MDKALKHVDKTSVRKQEEQLFRAEVLEQRSALWVGAIRLAQPISGWVIAGASAAISVALILFLCTGSVARKTRVAGVTVPHDGSLSIMAPNAGVLARSFVSEGQTVTAGQPLFELSTERQGSQGEITALIAQQLAVRKGALEAERRARLTQDADKRRALGERLANLDAEAKQIDQEIALVQRRQALAKKSLERYELLERNGFVSATQAQQKQEESIDLGTRYSGLARTRLELQANRLETAAEMKTQASALATDLAQIERAAASLNQEIAENQNRKTGIVVAPEAGTLTTLTYQAGQAVNAGQVLASMIPGSARRTTGAGELEAHLYAPSRATGFISPGQVVLIRYQSFPYEKFGLQEGTVVDVSKTPFAAAELPANLAGTILSYAQQQGSEGLYRIKVKLKRQTIIAHGSEQALKPGMTLEADIVQEHRRIWEWVAEPVLAVAHR